MPDITAVITSHTLTAADMIAAKAPEGVIHQMAPLDSPSVAKRFLKHWRPDLIVFAEGEIWPNLLLAAQSADIPTALVNARMTDKSLRNWNKQTRAARQLFGCFSFIGAADKRTHAGLETIVPGRIKAVGNLKRLAEPPTCPAAVLENWRTALQNRPILVAASTHAGEEELVLKAFNKLPPGPSNPALILIPRHPERADEIRKLIEANSLTCKQRSSDKSVSFEQDVLLADTIGEMGLWFRLADAIYLGGANAENVGGHNPIEPLKLEKHVFMGPHSFNFTDLVVELTPHKAITVGETSQDLAAFWSPFVNGGVVTSPDWQGIQQVFEASQSAMDTTLDRVLAFLKDADHA